MQCGPEVVNHEMYVSVSLKSENDQEGIKKLKMKSFETNTNIWGLQNVVHFISFHFSSFQGPGKK